MKQLKLKTDIIIIISIKGNINNNVRGNGHTCSE